ncbi:putative elongator complex protein 1 [Cryptotrichosporon argae]
MRSLSLTGLQIAAIPDASGRIACLSVDPESGTVYAAVERVGAEVHVDVVRIAGLDAGRPVTEVIATFSSALAPFPLPPDSAQVHDIHYFPDDRSLVVLLHGGDIATLALSGRDLPIEVVGCVDGGIKAAQWSPDDEQLVLVDGHDGMVAMTRYFDTVYEAPLRSDAFGEDEFINVGWGSKQTQFHGSLGKTAARASSSSPSSSAHPTDHGLPVITFRGDAAYFAVSSVDVHGGARRVRVYSRESSRNFAPALSATSEDLPGLEAALAWRPSGNVIAGLVRYGYDGGAPGRTGRWDVAMLERNGLRHGGFELREALADWHAGCVRAMAWNADSDVLAIWIERADHDVVQLWTMKNYHYYLKQEIAPHTPERRFSGIRWHAEQPMVLYLFGENHVQVRTYSWDTYAAQLPAPRDTATVAVVDGARLLVTPFRTQNTPPPMASYTIALPSTQVHVAHAPADDALAVLLADGTVQYYDLHTRVPDRKGSRLRGGGKVADPAMRWERRIGEGGVVKSLAVGDGGDVAVLSWRDGEGRVWTDKESWAVEPTCERVVWSSEGWLALYASGQLHALTDPSFALDLCASPTSLAVSADLVFALSNSSLYATSLSTRASGSVLANVSSFTLTPDFVITTSPNQVSTYIPLADVLGALNGGPRAPWETRRIERGAVAVVACPSEMSLVLQMPRGNLETVYPRPLVLAVVRRYIHDAHYRDAFLVCRRHRLDLNVLYDLDPAQFMERLVHFVDEVPEVDYLNLFVSALTPADSAKALYGDLARDPNKSVPENKVNDVCDALRAVLEDRGIVKYVETVLTTHVCKVPADYEAGLRVLLRLQAEHPDVVEDAVKYIIFLSDVNRLYDVALGMYDFALVLMIAHYSQKDPREYLPFLRELRALDTHQQRFRIDDHLGRRESALRNLKLAGPDKFDEAASYLSRYELYDEAFRLYADDEERLPAVRDLYGDYLYDRREFADAALSYVLAGEKDKALKAYEKAHLWREAFALVQDMGGSEQVVGGLVSRIADHLASRGRALEAAQIHLDYAHDVDAAVDVLCRGGEFAEAYRITSLHKRPDLVDDVVLPGLEEAHEAALEVFEEMRGQMDKEVARLKELQRVRLEDPDTFYIVEHEFDMENVDVATNATTVATAFTRYTVAPTVFSQSTKMTGQTNKTKHKPSRRRQAGRKGTVDEYEYLLASLGRLVLRAEEKSAEAIPLLRFLAAAHRGLAHDLQAAVLGLRAALGAAVDGAWEGRDGIINDAEASGGMALQGEFAKARAAEKPALGPWKGIGALV